MNTLVFYTIRLIIKLNLLFNNKQLKVNEFISNTNIKS